MKPLPLCLAFAVLGTSTLTAADRSKVPPPETKLVTPTTLITAEKFDQPSSLAPKGQPGWRGGIGEWTIKDGALHAKDEKPSAARPNGHEGVCEYVTEARDLVFTAQFKLGAAPHVGFVCRDTNNPNHHLGRIMVTPDKVWLQQMSGIAKQTKKEVLQTIEAKFDPEQWYQVSIEVRGDEWFARVGTHTLTARHERFKAPKGRIGLVAKGEGAQFKDVAIWHAKPKL
jgi:hypothetical protein